jgi:hypothetical protein
MLEALISELGRDTIYTDRIPPPAEAKAIPALYHNIFLANSFPVYYLPVIPLFDAVEVLATS